MSLHGTAAHRTAADLPPLVHRALAAAEANGFAYSCRPEQGRLLRALAQGAPATVAESGTGCGVGLAWLATGAAPGVRLLSVERDPARAAVAAAVFADQPQVTVVCADWTELYRHGPFDLLVLDGGGQGKGGDAADPARLLAVHGTVVVDDFTPATGWPPLHEGRPDIARMHWLEHPALRAVELRLAADLSAVVGRRCAN
ncbi:SAM-dependent methyltransferase [Streptomyces tateyamensis]|uniref:SAM-dependent methyltransferase n=1 Tax=Streptomyces tateyamensis TaxID=565073 RepID=A0A2V4NM78_9ACTN|nr:class I SAM-dependent methyltransferase [Streptomyces tateyamensis]PYC80839.1 SAM-dependent methyltransferase [Streptomyces tateyamensis]